MPMSTCAIAGLYRCIQSRLQPCPTPLPHSPPLTLNSMPWCASQRCLELCYPGARKPAAGAKKQQQAAAVPSVASSDGGDEDEDAYADDDEEEEEDDDMVGDDDDDDDDEGAESVEGVEVVAGAKKAPKVPKSKKPASCKGYLQGLVWLLDMYLTGVDRMCGKCGVCGRAGLDVLR